MKKIYLIICIINLVNFIANGQDTAPKFLLDKYKINFAVPDLPAFKAMGTEPSNLLRPSTTEAISLILPQFINNGQGVLPKSFAFEAAPFYLAHQRDSIPLTLGEYLQNKLWKSFRISMGTSSDSTKKEPGAIKLGFGLRFSIIDKGDLKSDIDYLTDEAKIFIELAQKRFDYKIEYVKNNNIKNLKSFEDSLKKDTVFNKKVKEFLSKKIQDYAGKRLQELKEEYKKKNWNAKKLDIAFAVVTRSPDQYTSNLKFNKFSAWLTYAKPCRDWGQLLIGGNFSNATVFSDKEKKDINFNEVSISSRLYVGSNNIKGFIEGQYTYKGFDKSNNGFIYIGGETAIYNGIWIHFYGGYQSGDTVSQVVSSLDFRFTLPEK